MPELLLCLLWVVFTLHRGLKQCLQDGATNLVRKQLSRDVFWSNLFCLITGFSAFLPFAITSSSCLGVSSNLVFTASTSPTTNTAVAMLWLCFSAQNPAEMDRILSISVLWIQLFRNWKLLPWVGGLGTGAVGYSCGPDVMLSIGWGQAKTTAYCWGSRVPSAGMGCL